MRSSGQKQCVRLAVCAVVGAASSAARGVIVWGGSGYNDSSITPAPGNLQNFEGKLDGYTATPISSNFLICATHLAIEPTGTFVYDNGTSLPTTYTVQLVATEDDMALYEIAPNSTGTFATFTQVYTGNNEVGSQIVDLGLGYTRGVPINNGQGNQGWYWAPPAGDGAFNWGDNTVEQIVQGNPGTALGGDLLNYYFQNDPVYPNGVVDQNECILTVGDSGGGVFIDVNGTYELAGVNTGADAVYTDSAGKNMLYGSLYNANGYYAPSGQGTYTLVTDGAFETSYATRLSDKTNLIGLADGSISEANAAQYSINDNGIVEIVQNLKTGAVVGGAALEVGNPSLTATLQIAQGSGASQLSSLTLTRSSTLDITNNAVFIAYSGSDPIVTIAGYIKSGYNGGHWNGAGIISSTAQAPVDGRYYGLGYADGSDRIVSGLSSGQIEIKYTLLGDANLDGVVNGSDFSILAANFGKGVTNWDQANFNYDSSVNGTDFSELAANFGQGVSGGSSVTQSDLAALDAFAAANGLSADLPEPGLGALVVSAAMAINLRRWRKPRI